MYAQYDSVALGYDKVFPPVSPSPFALLLFSTGAPELTMERAES